MSIYGCFINAPTAGQVQNTQLVTNKEGFELFEFCIKEIRPPTNFVGGGFCSFCRYSSVRQANQERDEEKKSEEHLEQKDCLALSVGSRCHILPVDAFSGS
jgi:hypothetical protein